MTKPNIDIAMPATLGAFMALVRADVMLRTNPLFDDAISTARAALIAALRALGDDEFEEARQPAPQRPRNPVAAEAHP